MSKKKNKHKTLKPQTIYFLIVILFFIIAFIFGFLNLPVPALLFMILAFCTTIIEAIIFKEVSYRGKKSTAKDNPIGYRMHIFIYVLAVAMLAYMLYERIAK